jgi:hypothetical protein
MNIYNVKPAEIDITVIKGDTIDLAFSLQMNEVDYVLTGLRLDMTIRGFDNAVIRTLSTHGTAPELIISAATFNIKTTPLTEKEQYKYDVQVTTADEEIFTFMVGKIIVKEEQTI